MIIVPRSTIWPGQTPVNSTGSPRPLLAPNRPLLAIHYTGGGLWLDPDDSPTEIRSIQAYAKGAGKGWEYNYVIDGQGIVYEYAGDYKAAHAGDPNNTNSYGVLLLVGLKSVNPPSGFEAPTEEMVAAVRDLRAWLVLNGKLAPDHRMLQHNQMPGAATMCPGPEVIKRWADLTAPPQPPDPPNPPEEDDTVSTARLVRFNGFVNVWLVGSGPALALTPELAADYLAAKVPTVFMEQHAQSMKALLAQSNLTTADLVGGGPDDRF